MREPETENGEEAIDEEGRNPTQQRLDREGVEERPVDAPWEAEDDERLRERGDR